MALRPLLAAVVFALPPMTVSPVLAVDPIEIKKPVGGFDFFAEPKADSSEPNTVGDAGTRARAGSFVRRAHQAVMMVGDPAQQSFGTAWVLSKKYRLLATNAHVADIYVKNGQMVALVNGSTQRYRVERAYYHPGVRRYVDGSPATLRSIDPHVGEVAGGPDLAVLKLSEDGPELPMELTMSGPGAFGDLLAEEVSIFGYPGHDNSEGIPDEDEVAEATYQSGVVSRYTDFDLGVNCPLAHRQRVHYQIVTGGGFSGSPIFLPSGDVVAVHNCALYRPAGGGVVKLIANGVRIDCLWELLIYHNLTDLVPVSAEAAKTVDVGRWTVDEQRDLDVRAAIKLTDEAYRLCYTDEDFAASAKKCNAAIELAPQYARPYGIRAMAFNNYVFESHDSLSRRQVAEQLQWALEDAVKFSELKPDNVWAAIKLAFVYNSVGFEFDDDDQNRKALKIALEWMERKVPTNARGELYVISAVALGNLDQPNLAIQSFAEAIRLCPDAPTFYESRASFWRGEGRYDLSRQDDAKAKELRASKR